MLFRSFNFGRYNGSLLPDEKKVFAPQVKAAMDTLMAWAVSGAIAPHVSHCVPLEQFREGMDLILTRAATGKVLLRIGADA